jgi:DNA invertase Pin-like site-specific DNA recombinase/uncharacterized small protein (DUF1192 family)
MLDKQNQIDAYYLRLSLADGDVTDGTMEESCSITSQRRCVQQYISERTDLGDEFREFIDDGYSGTNMERPDIRRLMKLVEQGRIRTIIVRDLSRFARNYLEAGHYLEFVFPAYGVRFISINDRYDSDDYGENPAGLDLAIRNLVNEMYSKDISKKIKSSVDLKKRNGEYVYGAVPYGYKKGPEKNTIVVDDVAAVVVKRIFKMAADGITVTEIAKTLNQEGIETPSQHLAEYRSRKYKMYAEWSWNSVKNIIENRIYTGDTEPFKSHVIKVGSDRTKQIPRELREIIPETHEAIVPRGLYYRAQTTIKSVNKRKGVSQHNALTSRLICGCCGNTLHKGKATNKNWLCSNARYTTQLSCKDVRADEAEITQILLRAIQQMCALTDFSLQENSKMQKVTKSKKELVNAEIRNLKRKQEKLEVKKRDLLEAVMDDKISRDVYVTKKKTLLIEENEITARIALLQQELKELDAADADTKEQRKAVLNVNRYQTISQLTPEVTRALIKRVIVSPDKQIRIEWNFSDNIIAFTKEAV